MKKFLLSIFAVMLAVFSVQAEEVTYTVTSTSAVSASGNVPSGSSVTYNSTFTNNKYQLTADNSMTLTLSGYAGCKITGIKLSMKSNTSKGAGSFSMKVGDTTLSSISDSKFNTQNWYGAWSTSYVDVTPTMSNANYTIADDEEVVITIAATTSSLYCQSFTITYEKEGAVSQPTFSVPEGSYSEPFDLVLSAKDGNQIYYTLDGTEPDVNSTKFTSAISVKASVLVKAIAVDGNDEVSSVAESNYVIESNAVSGKYVKATNLTDWTGNYLLVSEDYNVALDGSLTTIDAVGNYISVEIEEGTISATGATCAASFNIEKIDGGYSILSSSGRYIGRDAASNGMNNSTSTAYKNTIENGIVNGSGGAVLQYYSQPGSQRFRYYTSTQNPVVLYQYVASDYTLSVSDAGWATLFLNYDAEIPEGVTCYAVSAVDGEYATLAPVDGVIPANTGVIVEANEGSYTFKVATEEGSDVDNELIGTIVNTYITKEAYVLGIVDDVVGLYKAEMAGGVWLNNANKAYLPASAVPNKSAAFYGFDWEGTTGIDQITEYRVQSTAIYDLTGRRVEEVTAPGIYIINGVKTLVK